MSYFGTLSKTADGSTSTLLSRWMTVQPTTTLPKSIAVTPTTTVIRTAVPSAPLVEVDVAEPVAPPGPIDVEAGSGLGIGWETVAGLGVAAAGLLFVATRRKR